MLVQFQIYAKLILIEELFLVKIMKHLLMNWKKSVMEYKKKFLILDILFHHHS